MDIRELSVDRLKIKDVIVADGLKLPVDSTPLLADLREGA
jgi:hypothetical protein